ncbi:hypothetical protein B0H13DRAFT_2578780 [Mycena leptocephala]|nr:hypothetical protein B0H13DRAFT_2578780 [Mycena leptocephala]
MNKGKGILNRYVNPVTGGRINIFAEKTDKGEADACRSCGKTAKELKAQTPPAVLMCCNVCMKNGVRVLYCSRECQKVDYRQGKSSRLPHKASCGKTHVDDLKAADGTLDTGALRLYTTTPTTALQAQVEFLGRNSTAHYGFARPNGKYVPHQIQGQGGVLFLQMRKEAMEEHTPESIALMERLLLLSFYPTDVYKAGDYVWQLEREYEVDLVECHRRLAESTRHLDLWEAWLDWALPRIGADPSEGVRFSTPWYYLLARPGEFIHPKRLDFDSVVVLVFTYRFENFLLRHRNSAQEVDNHSIQGYSALYRPIPAVSEIKIREGAPKMTLREKVGAGKYLRAQKCDIEGFNMQREGPVILMTIKELFTEKTNGLRLRIG